MGNSQSTPEPPTPTGPGSPILSGHSGIPSQVPVPSDKQMLAWGEEMNKKDYRKYSTDSDLHPRLQSLSKSVGAIVPKSSVILGPSGNWMIYKKATSSTLAQHTDHFSEQVATKAAKKAAYEEKMSVEPSKNETQEEKDKIFAAARKAQDEAKATFYPKIPKNYKFTNDICLAPIAYGSDTNLGGSGTVFYLGNGIIATDGHTLFNKELTSYFILFDFSQKYFMWPNPNVRTTMNNKGAKAGEEVEIFNEIPLENVFELKRVICGQLEKRLDWILLELHPRKGQKLPEALRIMPPQRLRNLEAGFHPIFTIGHPWGTSAKVSYPPEGVEKYRVLKYNSWDSKSKDFSDAKMKYCIAHNLMIRVGNSGGPIFYDDKDGPVVIAAQGSLVNPGPDQLRKFGFYCNQQGFIDVTEPDSPFNWSTATKTSVWSYLLDPQSTVNLLCVADKTSSPGTLEFFLFLSVSSEQTFTNTNNPVRIGALQVGKNICNARKFSFPFQSICPLAGSSPACIVGLGVQFTPCQEQAPVAPQNIIEWENKGKFAKGSKLRAPTAEPIQTPSPQPTAPPPEHLIKYLALHIEGKDDPDPVSRIVLGRRADIAVGSNTIVFGAEGAQEVNPNAKPNLEQQTTPSEWIILDATWSRSVQDDEDQFKKLGVPVVTDLKKM